MEKIHQAYDKSFKKFFGVIANAKELIKIYFVGEHEKYKAWMDLDSLRSINTEHISQQYEARRMDLLYYCKLTVAGKEYDSYIVFEHKSDNDPDVIYQLKKYVNVVKEYHQTAGEAVIDATKEPFIFSLLFYSLKQKFNMPLHISEKSQNPAIEKELMQQNAVLVDLSRLSIAELHTHGKIGVYECLVKKATDDNFHDYVTLQDVDYLNKSFANMHKALKKSLLRFIFDSVRKHKAKSVDMEEIFNQLTNVFNKQKETIMSLSDFIKQQGRKEGKQEGIFTIAKNMLQKKTDINFIREVTGLPMASIRRLQVA